jgi:hypothetical protein
MYQQQNIIVVYNKLTKYKELYNFGHPLKPRGRSFLVVGLRCVCGGQFVEEILLREDGERRRLALHQRRLRLRRFTLSSALELKVRPILIALAALLSKSRT